MLLSRQAPPISAAVSPPDTNAADTLHVAAIIEAGASGRTTSQCSFLRMSRRAIMYLGARKYIHVAANATSRLVCAERNPFSSSTTSSTTATTTQKQ